MLFLEKDGGDVERVTKEGIYLVLYYKTLFQNLMERHYHDIISEHHVQTLLD